MLVLFCISACESCTWLRKNSVSTEAGELGISRGICLLARRLEVVAVACVLPGTPFGGVFRVRWYAVILFSFSFPSNAHELLQIYEAALPRLPLSHSTTEASPRGRSDRGRLGLPVHTGVRTGFQCLSSLLCSVYCVLAAFYGSITDCDSCMI